MQKFSNSEYLDFKNSFYPKALTKKFHRTRSTLSNSELLSVM